MNLLEKSKEIEEKANYCLNCKVKPCSNKGCPLGNNIPEFIKLVKTNQIFEAYKVLSQTTVLSGICGRICPHQRQCQGSCVRGIKGDPVSIGEIESYIFDKAHELGYSLKDCYSQKKKKKALKNRVAVIGGGPAGLTCAAFLAKEGIDVTIYEKHDKLGGILSHGIPEFRLPRDVLETTIKDILDLGIKVKYNYKLDKQKLNDLKEDIENGEYSKMIIKDITQLSRNTVHNMEFLQFLEDNDCKIESMDGTDLTLYKKIYERFNKMKEEKER